MSPQSDLSTYVRERIRSVFGEPQESIGSDARWSFVTKPDAVSIHVLLTGPHQPTVWIFDPNDRAQGVSHRTIAHREDVEEIIAHIEGRLQRSRRAEE